MNVLCRAVLLYNRTEEAVNIESHVLWQGQMSRLNIIKL